MTRHIHNAAAFAALALTALALTAGCKSSEKQDDPEFFTSGNREADQRAEQRIVKAQQLRGEGEATGADAAAKKTLYERLGGDRGLAVIVDDFLDRALADPRANFARKGVEHGGLLGVGGKSSEWGAHPDDVARMKVHFRQFLAVATGGPTLYKGRDMKAAHAGMKITNAEFDATVGDMKATLDALRIPVQEQKELLAVLESARAQVAEER
jgi:hemoglobin